MKINTATKFTIFRIILIPAILLILFWPQLTQGIKIADFYPPHLIAVIIFMIASITDAIDGYIARSTNTITNLGKFLDPVADKLLVNSALIYLAYTQHIPALLTIIMISRDIMVDALRLICVESNIVVAASKYGKLKTVFQMVAIILILLFAIPEEPIYFGLTILIYVTTLISVISGIDYFIKNRNVFKK